MEVVDIDKTGEIEKNTYTIRFCAPERITLENEKKNHMDDDGAFFCQPLQWQTIVKLAKTIKKTKKKIIKIEITGHAGDAISTMRCGPLSHEVLAFLLSDFPFDNKILLIQNKTCYGNSNLPKHSQLPFDYRENENYIPQLDENNYLCSILMTNNDITQILNTYLSVEKMCFYYGGVDKNQTGESDITFIQRKAKNLTDDAKEKFWNVTLSHKPNDLYYQEIMNNRERQRKEYCNQLCKDLQCLQQPNNNQYNDQYNLPPPLPQFLQMPYGGGNAQMNYNNGFFPNFMPNANIFPPQQPQFVPQAQQYQQNTYGMQQYQQNTHGMQLNNNIQFNNTTNTNNRNVCAPAYQTTQQRNQNGSKTNNININGVATNSDGNNIPLQDNPMEKNNENVLCDLTKGFCSCCKCW